MSSDFDALRRLLQDRFSCRGYRPDPVPRDVIESIVTVAGRAPSWCNAQPWQVIVADTAETDRFRTALWDAATSGAPQPDLPWPK